MEHKPMSSPGPWSVSPDRIEPYRIRDANGNAVNTNADGNVNLVAAAPDLLEALTSILESDGIAALRGHAFQSAITKKDHAKAMAALVKARGLTGQAHMTNNTEAESTNLLEEQWIAEEGIVKVAVTGGPNDCELVADCYGDQQIATRMAAANAMYAALVRLLASKMCDEDDADEEDIDAIIEANEAVAMAG